MAKPIGPKKVHRYSEASTIHATAKGSMTCERS